MGGSKGVERDAVPPRFGGGLHIQRRGVRGRLAISPDIGAAPFVDHTDDEHLLQRLRRGVPQEVLLPSAANFSGVGATRGACPNATGGRAGGGITQHQPLQLHAAFAALSRPRARARRPLTVRPSCTARLPHLR